MSTRNAREHLDACAVWLGDQDEDLSAGLKSAFDGLRLYEYWVLHPQLPEFCDQDADDESIDVSEHRVKALGYDPFSEPARKIVHVGAYRVVGAMGAAEKLLNSVAFVVREGDTARPLRMLREFLV